MKFTNDRKSPFKRNTNSSNYIDGKSQFNKKIRSQKTYMHYNNAIYMGGMVSYKRNGEGILLLDNGISAIVDSNYDSYTGHSMFFRQNMIVSLLHLKKGNYELALRTSHFIFKVPFYEAQDLANGNGVLIDYRQKKLFHLVYQRGQLIKKIVQSNGEILKKVFEFNLQNIVDRKHESAFKFNAKFNSEIRMINKNSKLVYGHFNQHHNLDGVCFKLTVDQKDYDKFDVDFNMKCMERGFYSCNRIQNFGERYFSNGNYYIGRFQNDSFEGKGMILYPEEIQGKWVHGLFENNKLVKMIQMSLGDQEDKQVKVSSKQCLKKIHEQNYKNWMSNKIETINWDLLFQLFEKGIQFDITDVVVEKEKFIKEEEERLSQIQNHFIQDSPSKEINKLLVTQKTINSASPQKIIINQHTSIKPLTLEVEPRSLQNQEAWFSEINSQLTKSKQSISQRRLNIVQLASSQKYSSNASKIPRNLTPKNASSFQTAGKGLRSNKKYETTDSVQI